MKLRRRKLPIFNKLLNEHMTSPNKPDGIENFMAKLTQPDNFHDYVIGRTAHDMTREAPLLRQISQFLASKNARLQGNEFVTEPYEINVAEDNPDLFPTSATITLRVQFCEKLSFLSIEKHKGVDAILLAGLLRPLNQMRQDDATCKDLRVSCMPISLYVNEANFQHSCSFAYGALKTILTFTSSDPEVIFFFNNSVESPCNSWWRLMGYKAPEE